LYFALTTFRTDVPNGTRFSRAAESGVGWKRWLGAAKPLDS